MQDRMQKVADLSDLSVFVGFLLVGQIGERDRARRGKWQQIGSTDELPEML